MNELLSRLGFEEDPFASTNAADEPRLASYFVPPPYFHMVQGDPRRPKSAVVLAPRGGGKTAQRRMIEDTSAGESYLCITYDLFDTPAEFRLTDATWSFHVRQVCQLMTLALLAVLHDDTDQVESLSNHQKKVLKFSIEQFLGDLSADRFERGTKAIKSLPDKARDLWTAYGGPLAGVLNIILKRLQLEAVNLDDAFQVDMAREESLRFHLTQLSEIAQAIGFLSTYILVDRVDEIELTATDAAATFAFIRPLLVDLPTLEEPGISFKFFLWDAIRDDYLANGARRDRVAIHELSWSTDDLKTMMSERLKAYSGGARSTLRELMCEPVLLDVDTLAAHLAAGSPRDMIRLMNQVVAERTRVSAGHDCISEEAFWEGVRSFSEIRAGELFPRYLPDLRRVGAAGKVTFTVNHLANDVFRVEQQSARNKVQNWMRTGLVDRIDEVPNPPNRPMYLYGAVDLRLAIAMLTDFSPAEVLGMCTLVCPSCGGLTISDAQSMACRECGHRFELKDADSLLACCTDVGGTASGEVTA